VTRVPNPRPPSPHSSRLDIDAGRRQRAATNPPAVTRTKKKMSTVSTTPSTPDPDARLIASPRYTGRGPQERTQWHTAPW
jgi:hypothetical protein